MGPAMRTCCLFVDRAASEPTVAEGFANVNENVPLSGTVHHCYGARPGSLCSGRNRFGKIVGRTHT
jgi:hypothetical protein